MIGFLALLLVAFGAGYFIRSQGCVLDTVVEKVTQQVSPTARLTATPTISAATVSPAPAETKAPQTELVFSNYNSAAVGNQPTGQTVFTLSTARAISSIQDYHWNSAKGKTPGTIGLKDGNDKLYGPWEAKGDPGQGGVPNAYWTVFPNLLIPAGTYTIIDSDPASWAQNGGSKGLGMSQVYAVKE